MHTLRHIDVGIRSQAVLVFALTALWWCSCFHWLSEMESSRLFWIPIFVFAPFVMLLFAAILLISYRRAGRAHRWLVRSALLAAVSPWLLLLWLCLAR